LNFDNESIITIKTHELFEKCLIEKWYNFISALEHYNSKSEEGLSINMAILRAKLLGLFYSCIGDLRKNWKKEEIIETKKLIYSTKSYDELISIFENINDVLSSINITGTKVERLVEKDVLITPEDFEISDIEEET
jgi:hypothetical protein